MSKYMQTVSPARFIKLLCMHQLHHNICPVNFVLKSYIL